jgi:hypothetical protein
VVVDGQTGAKWDVVANLNFSPEGELEYLAEKGNSLYRARYLSTP